MKRYKVKWWPNQNSWMVECPICDIQTWEESKGRPKVTPPLSMVRMHIDTTDHYVNANGWRVWI